jgi:hypothetical protein
LTSIMYSDLVPKPVGIFWRAHHLKPLGPLLLAIYLSWYLCQRFIFTDGPIQNHS